MRAITWGRGSFQYHYGETFDMNQRNRLKSSDTKKPFWPTAPRHLPRVGQTFGESFCSFQVLPSLNPLWGLILLESHTVYIFFFLFLFSNPPSNLISSNSNTSPSLFIFFLKKPTLKCYQSFILSESIAWSAINNKCASKVFRLT